MVIVFLGAPGSGKGTHAKRLASKLGLPHVSSGDLLREAIEKGTELGRLAEPHLRNGTLVPDDIMLAWVEGVMEEPANRAGLVLDGFPRTVRQAEVFDDFLSQRGLKVNCVLLLEIDEDEAVKRLSSRVSCSRCGAVYNLVESPPAVEGVCDACGGSLNVRPDDREETVRVRFEEFRQLTVPVIDYYRSTGRLASVDTSGPVEEVEGRVASAHEKQCVG